MSVEFHVKCREAYQLLADAHNDEIEKKNPERIEQNYNPETIKWSRTTGPNGVYERYPAQNETPEATPDYKGLLADLNVHKGRLQRAGLFYWLFTDGVTIGRKPSKK